MSLELYDSDAHTLITPPYFLGNFVKNESPYKLLWLKNTGPTTIKNLQLKIEKNAALTNAFLNWKIAKRYYGRPAAPVDFMNSIKFKIIPLGEFIPFYVKFIAEDANIDNNSDIQTCYLRAIGETV